VASIPLGKICASNKRRCREGKNWYFDKKLNLVYWLKSFWWDTVKLLSLMLPFLNKCQKIQMLQCPPLSPPHPNKLPKSVLKITPLPCPKVSPGDVKVWILGHPIWSEVWDPISERPPCDIGTGPQTSLSGRFRKNGWRAWETATWLSEYLRWVTAK
jgi:hypothetical protein